MLSALHVLSLGIASALIGVWSQGLLVSLGLRLGFDSRLWISLLLACIYAAAQLSFHAALSLLKPTRARSFYVCDILSQCAAIALVPSLLGLTLPLPHASLQRIEPLIHGGCFAAVHAFFKLMTFFAAVQGPRSSRMMMFPWAGAACLALGGAYFAGLHYLRSVTESRPVLFLESAPVVADNIHALAQQLPERARLVMPVPPGPGAWITAPWARPEGNASLADAVTVMIDAYESAIEAPEDLARMQPLGGISLPLAFSARGWTEQHIDRASLPENAKTLVVSWTTETPGNLLRRIGLNPSKDAEKTLWFGQPFAHSPGERRQAPPMVVIAVEGLGAENMELYGYARRTTPALKERASSLIRFEEAYTPTPEASGALMSLLTGLNPLAHGYYESYAGPLPENVRTLTESLREQGYYAAAFTEGAGLDGSDLVMGSEFARGFAMFSDHLPLERTPPRTSDQIAPTAPTPAGAHVTLQRAADWIEAHGAMRYFVFLRLRELRSITPSPRYGDAFVGRGRKPAPMDVYDDAVTYLDRHLGAFLDRMKELPSDNQPVLVVASPHGYDFTEAGRGAWRRGGAARRSLHESCIRVPLLMQAPGMNGRSVNAPVSLLDVAPTLAAMAGIVLPHAEGRNLLRDTGARDIVSLLGDPVALSVRSGRWRFTWASGLTPFYLERVGEEAVLDFLDIARYRNDLSPQDNIRREPELVQAFKRDLTRFLEAHKTADADAVPAPETTGSR